MEGLAGVNIKITKQRQICFFRVFVIEIGIHETILLQKSGVVWQVETTLDLLKVPIKLTDRNTDDQRDGYVELLPYRQSFDNVTKTITSKGIQTGLALRENDAQTTPTMLVNSWFQYRYDHKTINTKAYNEDEKSAIKKFLDKFTDDMCDKV